MQTAKPYYFHLAYLQHSPINELFTFFATNPYCESKLIAEHILLNLEIRDPVRGGSRHSTCSIRRMCTKEFYSTKILRCAKNNPMSYFVQMAVCKLEKLLVFGDGTHTYSRTAILLHDAGLAANLGTAQPL